MPSTKQSMPILIVEDSDEDFDALMRVFEKAQVVNPIHRCKNGDDALAYLFGSGPYAGKAKRPGIIFLDLNLPGTDGREVLQTIKADPALKSIPTLILTSSHHPHDVRDSYESGANTYVVKPSAPAEFQEVVGLVREYWFSRGVILDEGE